LTLTLELIIETKVVFRQYSACCLACTHAYRYSCLRSSTRTGSECRLLFVLLGILVNCIFMHLVYCMQIKYNNVYI
jgi:hypothetical protein